MLKKSVFAATHTERPRGEPVNAANSRVPCPRLARPRRRARGRQHRVASHPSHEHRRGARDARRGRRGRGGRVRPERRDQVRVLRAQVHDHPDLLRGGAAGDDQEGHRQGEGATPNPRVRRDSSLSIPEPRSGSAKFHSRRSPTHTRDSLTSRPSPKRSPRRRSSVCSGVGSRATTSPPPATPTPW